MNNTIENKINLQREKVLGAHPEVELVAPCKLGEGILNFSEHEIEKKISAFEKFNFSSCFFIPASGSGSRMFQFLYDFLQEPNDENRGQVEKFLNHIEDFAFYQQLPLSVRKKLRDRDVDLEEFVSFLLEDHGMGFGNLPKGLIPFHKLEPFILTPFQEQVLQGIKLKEEKTWFHFTIQSEHKNKIQKVIQNVQGVSGQFYEVDFSEQAKNTNSIPFTNEGEPLVGDNGQYIERPSGHGALIENLNQIDADIIYIKNIDNIQHYHQADEALDSWKILTTTLLEFKKEAKNVFQNPSLDGVLALNQKYELYNEDYLKSLSMNDLISLLNRPTRVCGMVRNEGQPGGGPFWIKDGDVISKQIVEKAQITLRGKQYRLMVQSQFFNPVMIVASTKDFENKKFDLHQFVDESKYFVVKKKHKGTDVKFLEMPGLWNGSMAFWNTIFVEIPSITFSPVKTVLDLLDDAHRIDFE